MTEKYILSLITLTLCATTNFARTEYNKSTSVTSDISDSWIVVDYPKSSGDLSTTRGNVIVSIEEGVSVTADYLNVYGANSEIVFKGNNQVNAGSISIYGGADTTGSSIQFNNATVNANSIYLREESSSLIIKDSTVTTSGVLALTTGSQIVVDNSSFTVDQFKQIGIYTKETSANIKIQNGGTLSLTGKGNGGGQQGHNIYVDASSTFSTLNTDAFYGTLTLEEGAKVAFSDTTKTKFESVILVFDDSFVTDDILNMQDFTGFTVNGETVVVSQLSEKVIVQNNLGDQYEMTFDEVTGRYSVGEYVGSVPEPSTYATIFGTLALAFVAYRRRK